MQRPTLLPLHKKGPRWVG